MVLLPMDILKIIFKKIEEVNSEIFLLEKENLEIRKKFKNTELGKQFENQKTYHVTPEEFNNGARIAQLEEEVRKNLFSEARSIIEEHKESLKVDLYETYYKELIEYGDPEASFRLGILYEGSSYDGDMIERNYHQAINYYKVSAELGNLKAMNNLGRMYGKGLGVEVDHQESINWYTRAIKHLHGPACFNLGAKYVNGTGVEKDYILAAMWMQLAIIFGDFASERQKDLTMQNIHQLFENLSEEEKNMSLRCVSDYLIANNLKELHAKTFGNKSPAQDL
tara:strand:+ start:60 stop:899 length:840 start_codon:yes stop_codon:yes gene_type:complete